MLEHVVFWFRLKHFAPGFAEPAAIAIIILVILIAGWVVALSLNFFLSGFINRVGIKSEIRWALFCKQQKVVPKLSRLALPLIIYMAIPIIISSNFTWTATLSMYVQKFLLIYMLLLLVFLMNAIISVFGQLYNSYANSKRYPIRGYLQVIRLFLWGVFLVVSIPILVGKSPLIFLTGLGAASAVIMLVFKDTILGFVASIQVSIYNLVEIGDWVTMPHYGIDGNILDISINTVKVQNFDKTIITIPTASLVSTHVQNWRGMSEAGGRRIKRSINIDIDSIKFCDAKLLEKLNRIDYLKDYIETKIREINLWNQTHHTEQALASNGRHLTNIGLFRAYISSYLQKSLHIRKDLTFLIRQLQSTETGLPLQIYVFTNDTDWIRYEGIQSDIFDHLFAAMKDFELSAFQLMSSRSLMSSSQLPAHE